VLSRAGEFFSLEPARIPDAGELALRRAAQRRGKAITDANRALRRVISLARWAFPDVWNAFAGSRPTALSVLRRWPHLQALGRARVVSVAEVVAAHTRGVTDVEARATRIRNAAAAWCEFWDGHLDLDALAWETGEVLDDLAGRVGIIDRGLLVAEGTPDELKRRIGSDVVIARIDGDVDSARRSVGGASGVTAVDVHGDELTISVDDGATAVSPVAVALNSSGVRVRELTLRTPTLDDVFLELTGNRIQADGESEEDE
jgi:hypothetical protein